MPTPVTIALIITALPILAWTIEFLHAFVRREIPSWADLLSTAAVGGSCFLSLYLLFTEVLFGGGVQAPYVWSMNWFSLGEGVFRFTLDFDVMVDNLTIIMFCVVTIVAFLVHVYSRSYMHDEERYPRFFFFLSLFTFSMLALLTTSNLMMLFIFWELVGVCSYFLIGFFLFKDSAANANKKAFVTNRIGDACFMAGILLIYTTLSNYSAPVNDATVVPADGGGYTVTIDGKTEVVNGNSGRFLVKEYSSGALEVRESWTGMNLLEMRKIWESVGRLGGHLTPAEEEAREANIAKGIPVPDRGPWDGKLGLLYLTGFLLFMGCVTKSAQFPLHVWLPDAMEGPTPVSALIHAATMVAAGVYLIARMFPVLAGEGYMDGDYFSSPTLLIIAMIGGITAIFAGTIALVQTDLKKGLAYSTCSQLGYMVCAIGCGSIFAALFHLFTHAFFKACLFLGSGSAIHAVHSQEMSDMGGLKAKMPITRWTFLISCLAISGVPLFSGFLSKEAILGQAAAFGLYKNAPLYWVPFGLLAVTAVLTSFYMFRLYFLTFEGKPGNQKKFDHAHESPKAMALPLVVLATLAIISGGLAFPGAPTSEWFLHSVDDVVLVKGTMTSTGSDEAKELFKEMTVIDRHAHEVKESEVGHAVYHFTHALHQVHYPIMGFSLFAVLFGVGTAFFLFMKKREVDYVAKIAPLAKFRVVLKNLYYVDWFYCFRLVPSVKDITNIAWWFDKKIVDGVVNGAGALGRSLARLCGAIDKKGVDGAVNGAGKLSLAGGSMFRGMVNGRVQDYVKYTLVGMGVVLVLVILSK